MGTASMMRAAALVMTLAVFAWLPHSASAATVCNEGAPRGVAGDLVVPPNGFCQLAGNRITGDVVVEEGALLIGDSIKVGGSIFIGPTAAFDAFAVRVSGDIRADGHQLVNIAGATSVAGSIVLTNGVIFSSVVDGARVGGDIVVTGNNQPILQVTGNRVAGRLICSGNTPPPTVASNRVAGTTDCPGV